MTSYGVNRVLCFGRASAPNAKIVKYNLVLFMTFLFDFGCVSLASVHADFLTEFNAVVKYDQKLIRRR